MHTRGDAVVISDSIQVHVLGVRKSFLQTVHYVVHTLFEVRPRRLEIRVWRRHRCFITMGRCGHIEDEEGNKSIVGAQLI